MSPDLIEAIAALLWPVMAFAAIAYLAPIIRERFRKGELSIRVGDFELTSQEANDQIRKQIEDLREKIAALELPHASVPSGPEATVERQEPRPLSILWVDDNPRNNASLIDALRAQNHTVNLARTTAEALKDPMLEDYDLILSDVGRPEGPRAGIELLRALRKMGVPSEFGLFTTARSAALHREEASALGASFATASGTDLFAEITRIANRKR
jgi:CheY-like chemotaxis protein